jgi:hypothetical protein
MTRYILNDVRRNFADNIGHLIDKKVRQVEIETVQEALSTHVNFMVTALNKLNIRVQGFNPRDINSIKWFFKKVDKQIKANSVTIEHRRYGDRPGDKPEDKMRSGYFFFKQWAENTPPEIAYWISDPIYSPRPSLLYNGQGTKIGKPRWIIYTNVPS